ncbi:MAG: hypothetical protein KF708_17815 [Pirellulales bacterium]|nr:hypothetical protein [Pirellulales bacterium]
MHPSTTASGAKRSWAAFVVVQVILLAAGAAWAASRVRDLRAERALPPLRSEPLTVRPTYNNNVVVSDDQLRQVLTRLVPKFHGQDSKVNNIDHALRFWGLDAKFSNPACISGEDMRRLLLDNHRFVEVFGAETAPLLMDIPGGGVKVRVKEGQRSSSHYDHTIAGLAEVGTPLDFPVTTATQQTTYRAMLEQSLRDFSVNQWEYEWSALAYTLFLPDAPGSKSSAEEPLHWVTQEGQRVDFDFLAERIMRQEVPQGVCAANHRMHALVMMLRIDDEHKILSPEGRQRIIEYLQGITQILVKNQHPDGYWTMDWPAGIGIEPKNAGDLSPLAGHILATGHPLEWWSLAPEEVHPPRHVLAAAGQWLSNAIINLTDEQVEEYYTFLTHAGRALSLWRGRFPTEVDLGDVLVPADKSTSPATAE